ncbi:MAG: hypothetical protein EOO39_01405 [Cytophagaceae bacterium]|nr:MAG: hypothetical protein EOO39_01405 [Cytophagaceae bacterium]
MASNQTKDLHPRLVEAYLDTKERWIKLHPDGPNVVLTCTYRSNEEQAALYAKGRTAPGKRVTNAKPGSSNHNKYPSHAFDVGFLKGKKMDWTETPFRAFAKLLLEHHPDITWGGRFKSLVDLPHFEI